MWKQTFDGDCKGEIVALLFMYSGRSGFGNELMLAVVKEKAGLGKFQSLTIS